MSLPPESVAEVQGQSSPGMTFLLHPREVCLYENHLLERTNSTVAPT